MQPTKLGIELLRIRHKYGWTRGEMAFNAKVSALTILRLENPAADNANRKVSQPTIKKMISHLANAQTPISREDAIELAELAGITPSVLNLPPEPKEPSAIAAAGSTTITPAEAARLMQVVFRLAEEMGVSRTEAMLGAIVDGSNPNAAGAEPTEFRYVSAPKRGAHGGIEQVMKTFVQAPATAPTRAIPRKKSR